METKCVKCNKPMEAPIEFHKLGRQIKCEHCGKKNILVKYIKKNGEVKEVEHGKE